MSWRAQSLMITVIAIIVGIILVTSVATFTRVIGNSGSISGLYDRLEALEHNKARATAKRWTSDDTMELIACLEIPYAQRGECLKRITDRFNKE